VRLFNLGQETSRTDESAFKQRTVVRFPL